MCPREARFAGSLRARWASVISVGLGEGIFMQTWYRVAAGAIGWFVIGLHYYLIASRPDVGLAEAASRMLSSSPS